MQKKDSGNAIQGRNIIWELCFGVNMVVSICLYVCIRQVLTNQFQYLPSYCQVIKGYPKIEIVQSNLHSSFDKQAVVNRRPVKWP